MKNIIEFLDGKKTFIVSAAIIIFNAAWMAGIIEPRQEYVEAINYLLVAAGLTTLKLSKPITK